METFFIFLTIAFAIINWYAVTRNNKILEYIAKPGTTTSLLALFITAGGFQDHSIWFAIGLFFSLLGDIFLVLPKDQFILGLTAFLIGQVLYIIGFNPGLPPTNLPGAILTVFVGLAALRIYRAIAWGLRRTGQEKLQGPVLAYTTVISLMLLSALMTLLRPEWKTSSALLVSSGALFFFVSDGMLAWDKFVHTIHLGRLATMVTYHLGQVLIVIGVMMQYSML